MENKDKEKEQSKHIHPETLGLRMLSFAQEKLASVMECVGKMLSAEIHVTRFRTSDTKLFQPKRDSMNQNIKRQYFIYAHYPILSNIAEKRTREKRPGTDQRAMLPSRMLNLFSRSLNIRLPSVYIHQNDLSDKFLRGHHADAMTIGNNIYFKTGKFDLKSVRGLSLLGHELTHVAQQRTEDCRHTGVRPGSEHIEGSAIDNERLIMRNADMFSQQRGVASTGLAMPSVSSAAHAPSENGVGPPMFADESRTVGESSAEMSTAISAIALSESQMAKIKDEVYRDLMMRIKVESERGA